jgi:hypothetical protein
MTGPACPRKESLMAAVDCAALAQELHDTVRRSMGQSPDEVFPVPDVMGGVLLFVATLLNCIIDTQGFSPEAQQQFLAAVHADLAGLVAWVAERHEDGTDGAPRRWN